MFKDFIEIFNNLNSTYIIVLLGLMLIDCISGIVKSFINKTTYSSVLYYGMLKKVGIILVLALAFLLDTLFVFDVIFFNVICLFYCAYEGLSIIENLNACGINFPKFLTEHLYLLEDKSDKGGK